MGRKRAATTDAGTVVAERAHPDGYARYARVRGDIVYAPNYISEHAAPAMLCLLRSAEPRPYTPLPREVISHHAQPLDMESRPSSYVAHQAIMDLYRTLNGQYGVTTDMADLSDLFVLGGGGGGDNHPTRPLVGMDGAVGSGAGHKRTRDGVEGTSTSHASPTHAVNALSGSHETAPVQPPPPPLPDGTSAEDFSKLADAYRLGQFRRQAQHVDNKVFTRGCTLYSRGHCPHGARCHFLHIGKNGVVVPTAGSRE